MSLEVQPQPVVTVRRTWTFGRDGTEAVWGVVLRGPDGAPHVVTAPTPEGVGEAVAAHLRSLAAQVEAPA